MCHLPVWNVNVDSILVVQQTTHICHGSIHQPLLFIQAALLQHAGQWTRVNQTIYLFNLQVSPRHQNKQKPLFFIQIALLQHTVQWTKAIETIHMYNVLRSSTSSDTKIRWYQAMSSHLLIAAYQAHSKYGSMMLSRNSTIGTHLSWQHLPVT